MGNKDSLGSPHGASVPHQDFIAIMRTWMQNSLAPGPMGRSMGTGRSIPLPPR